MLSRRAFLSWAALGAASISAGALLGSCTNSSASTSTSAPSAQSVGGVRGSEEVVVVMSDTSEPAAGFDPFYSWGCGEHVHEPLIQSTLVTTNAQLEFENDLATSYSCSPDLLTWTFFIRDDVCFSDGSRLTAHDVAFTLNGIKAFEGSELDLSYMKQARAVSDTQVDIELNKPFNALLYTLAVVGIVPAATYDAASYGAHPVGSGRYVLEQWDKGQQVILAANPNYYGEAPKMKRVVVLFASEDSAFASARSGAVDIAYTSATLANQPMTDDFELVSCKSVDCRGISLPSIAPGTMRSDGLQEFPAGNAVTCHEEIRKAINLALDRETLIANTLNGHGTLAYSVCDGMPWGSADMQVQTNFDEAVRILEQAGWKRGEDGTYAKDGLRAAFNLYYSAGDSLRQAMAYEFANQMKQLGIEVTPVGSSWTTDPDGLYAHQFSDPILWGWGANSPTQLYDLTYSTGWGNYACYENPKIDAHLDAALACADIAESYAHWQAAQWDGETGVAPQGAATWVWLANVDHLYFARKGLQLAEQKPHPHGHGWSLVNNVDKWSW